MNRAEFVDNEQLEFFARADRQGEVTREQRLYLADCRRRGHELQEFMQLVYTPELEWSAIAEDVRAIAGAPLVPA